MVSVSSSKHPSQSTVQARSIIGNEHERLAPTADGRRPIKTSIDVADCSDDQFVRYYLDVVVHGGFWPIVIFNAERRSAVAARFQGVGTNYIAVCIGDGLIRTAPSVIRGIEHLLGVTAVGKALVVGVRAPPSNKVAFSDKITQSIWLFVKANLSMKRRRQMGAKFIWAAAQPRWVMDWVAVINISPIPKYSSPSFQGGAFYDIWDEKRQASLVALQFQVL